MAVIGIGQEDARHLGDSQGRLHHINDGANAPSKK